MTKSCHFWGRLLVVVVLMCGPGSEWNTPVVLGHHRGELQFVKMKMMFIKNVVSYNRLLYFSSFTLVSSKWSIGERISRCRFASLSKRRKRKRLFDHEWRHGFFFNLPTHSYFSGHLCPSWLDRNQTILIILCFLLSVHINIHESHPIRNRWCTSGRRYCCRRPWRIWRKCQYFRRSTKT